MTQTSSSSLGYMSKKHRKPKHYLQCKETAKRKRIKKFVECFNFNGENEEADARSKIYHVLENQPITTVPLGLYKLDPVSFAFKHSLIHCVPSHLEIDKHYTDYEMKKEVSTQLSSFIHQFSIVLITSPYPAIMVNLSIILKKLELYDSICLVFQGDGRNLTFKGDISRTDNITFGFKMVRENRPPFFLPIGMIWEGENKITTLEILEKLNFEIQLSDVLNNSHINEVILCTDMKFQWIFLGMTWDHCIFCGANRDWMKNGAVGHGPQTRTLPLQYTLAMDPIHIYLRCFEGIVDLIQQGIFKKLFPLKRTSQENPRTLRNQKYRYKQSKCS